MIFNYDPILGLQYYSNHEESLIFKMAYLPPDKKAEELIKEWREGVRNLGISIMDLRPIEEPSVPIFSNF